MKRFISKLLIFSVFSVLTSCAAKHSYHCQCDNPNSGRIGTESATVSAKNQDDALTECQAEFPGSNCSATKEF